MNAIILCKVFFADDHILYFECIYHSVQTHPKHLSIRSANDLLKIFDQSSKNQVIISIYCLSLHLSSLPLHSTKYKHFIEVILFFDDENTCNYICVWFLLKTKSVQQFDVNWTPIRSQLFPMSESSNNETLGASLCRFAQQKDDRITIDGQVRRPRQIMRDHYTSR